MLYCMFYFTCDRSFSAPAEVRVLLQLSADSHQKTLICSCLCGPSSVVPENTMKIKISNSEKKNGLDQKAPLDFMID